jgi:hypothetical protein
VRKTLLAPFGQENLQEGDPVPASKKTIQPCVNTFFPMTSMKHLTMAELVAGLDEIKRSPKDEGLVELIVRRPGVDEREVLDQGELSIDEGLVGDSWKMRGSARTPDGSPHPDMQINVMNSRTIALVAQSKQRWPLAGDQIFLDLDLSAENLPAGTKLELGSAVIEVTAPPHTGCMKFVSRFGLDAMLFVNSSLGKQLHLRGINARVIKPGIFRVGDVVRKR